MMSPNLAAKVAGWLIIGLSVVVGVASIAWGGWMISLDDAALKANLEITPDHPITQFEPDVLRVSVAIVALLGVAEVVICLVIGIACLRGKRWGIVGGIIVTSARLLIALLSVFAALLAMVVGAALTGVKSSVSTTTIIPSIAATPVLIATIVFLILSLRKPKPPGLPNG